MVTLYSTHCPNCMILEKSLKKANIDFEIIDDINIIQSKGIQTAPTLEVDGQLLNYNMAKNWLKENS